jgi:MFS family permease
MSAQNQQQQQTEGESSTIFDEEDQLRNIQLSDRTLGDIEEDRGLRSSLKEIFTWHNYTIYLITAWIFNAGATIWPYLNLYLRALDWDYILIGAVMTLSGVLTAVFRFIGGYIGDNSDRKNLSVVSMFLIGSYSVIIGIFTDLWMITLGIIILACAELTKSGSSAYIMENIPRERSGLALSLFTSGKSFGIITLLVFGALIPLYGFDQSIRFVYFINGILLVMATIVRAILLENSETLEKDNEEPILRDFMKTNVRTIKILASTIPGIIIVMFIDGLSDSIFRFGSLIYTNETVGIDIAGINIILLTTLLFMVPFLLKVGRVTDRVGVQKTSVMVYGIMPISAFLLFLAGSYKYWVPVVLVESADTIYPGLGVVFSLPFLGILLKSINDQLWWLILLALIRKKLPERDTSKILAVLLTVTYLCSSIGPLIGAFLFETLPQQWLFFVVIVLNLIILVTLATTRITEDKGRIHLNERT